MNISIAINFFRDEKEIAEEIKENFNENLSESCRLDKKVSKQSHEKCFRS